jgi:hypothetical protein
MFASIFLFAASCGDFQESLPGEDRQRFSGATNKVTKRNNTDQNLDSPKKLAILITSNKALLYIAVICFNSINRWN